MQFVVFAYDATDEGAYERRMAVRPDHLANIEATKEKGLIICAGGMTGEDGKLKGSVLVMDFDSRELLDEYLESEPYIQNNVWGEIKVEPLNVLIVNNGKFEK